MNKQLTDYTNNELLNEILDRVNQEATTISILADLFALLSNIVMNNPDLYRVVIAEAQKRLSKK